MDNNFFIPGPATNIGEEIHRVKYREEGEDFRECVSRVANGLQDNDDHYHVFRDILLNMRFIPAGRILRAIGSVTRTTPYNCYLSGPIADNFTGRSGIMARASEAAETMRMGGGIGYSFDQIRPAGDLIQSLQSLASGPVSFMNIYDAVCSTVASAGHRRGAQMAVLPVWHPDIVNFIRIKQGHIQCPALWDLVDKIEDPVKRDVAFRELQLTNKLTGFNISVGMTDEFIRAVEQDTGFNLRYGGRTYNTVQAKMVYETIMRSTWDCAEPGVLFLDTVNNMNNLHYCETISATNPCGEQPLPPFGACLLGSFNLTKYVKRRGKKWVFDYSQLDADIPHVVRAMDNVVDVALYPLEEQETEAKSKRRMGLGITGLANALEACGHPYASEGFLKMQGRILKALRDGAYWASVELAKEKGHFPLFDKEKYAQGKFIKTLPKPLQQAIKTHGIRNSHLTSIAPTGTISLTADNVSSGIEPVFSHRYDRTINTYEGPIVESVEDYGVKFFGVEGRTTASLTADEHLQVLLVAQKYVDSAVSKTCNVDPNMPWEDFKELYLKAWRGGAKGITTFNPAGKRMGILHDTSKKSDAKQCKMDTKTGKRECE